MAKLNMSLVIITLNEEKNIERCIKSVPFASEILVLDSGSQDQTRKLAESLGARVLDEPWQGFGKQKQRATELAKYDWILNLDADEALSEELQQEIQSKFSSLESQTGYELSRKSFHLGRWILHGGWFPDRQLRLYHRKFSKWSDQSIHEKVLSPQKARLKGSILHWVFDELSDQIQTNDRYSSLQAQELFRKKTKFSVIKLVVKPWSKFFECYFLKKGFLDGLPGFVIAVGAAYSVFLRWSKLWELENKTK